jgi:hypothetical protein
MRLRMGVRVGVSVRVLIGTKDAQGLFHEEESCKSNKYPQAGEIKINPFNLRIRDPYPMRIFRFSSTMTKWTPEPWCSPINECGTRCKKTSESKPPVYIVNQTIMPDDDKTTRTAKAVMVLRVSPLISAGIKARMKLGTLFNIIRI